MTKIPPEHTAAKALEDSFRALGEQRARAQRRRPSWRPARVVLTALTSLVLVAGVATGTKVILGDGDALRSDDNGLNGLGGRLEPAPAYRALAQASAPDPVERQPWGMRTYRSAAGDSCMTAGRVAGGRLGAIRVGQFRELPTKASGICGRLDVHHYVMASRVYGASAIPGGRTIVYGLVDRTVTDVAIVTADGRSSPVTIAADGTFMEVHKGTDPLHRAHLVIDGSEGRRTQLIAR